MKVLVTGGTGTLGRVLVGCLAERGHDVTAVSRHVPKVAHPGVRYVQADVVVDFERAVLAVVVAVANRADAHVVYVSIVGVDRNRLSYYRAKLAAERIVESTGHRWSIQRATQFHDLVDRFLRFPVFPATPHLAFQPVDTRDVSSRLADLASGEPIGRAPDFGGPEVVGVRELAAVRRRVVGRAARLVPVPALGMLGMLGDYDRGTHLCPDHREGVRTWEWLAAR